MRIHPISAHVRDLWKTFPLRVEGKSVSGCCGEPTLLVQSMDGGFVTRNCSKCGAHTTLPNRAFFNDLDLWVACPQCRSRMSPDMVEKNYGYVCHGCDLAILVASILPFWEDLV